MQTVVYYWDIGDKRIGAHTMYILGLFVIVDPESFDLVFPEIQSFNDIEIKVQNPQLGTLVLAVSSEDEQRHKILFDKIKSLPFVMNTEIMYFYRDDDDNDLADTVGNSEDSVSRVLKTYTSYNSITHTRH